MTGSLGWSLLSCAVLLLPGGAHPALVPTPVPARAAAERVPVPVVAGGPRRTGPMIAAAAVGLACVSLLGGPRGVLVSAISVPLVWVGLVSTQVRQTATVRDPALPLVLDLAASALRAGRPMSDALSLAAEAAGPDVAGMLARVAGLLRLGADAPQAWAVVPRAGSLAEVAQVAVRSAASGIKVAASFERLAADLRAELGVVREIRAHRAGVLALAPLAACFLPSFVCLGVLPVVVGIAGSALGVMPGSP